jgi:hypothetical protein
VRIAVIGGLERHEGEVGRVAGTFGHTVEFHRGRVGGRHAGELEAIVRRCDFAVIVTRVNSHGAMYIAKRAAARYGRPLFIARTCSPSSFSVILDGLAEANESTMVDTRARAAAPLDTPGRTPAAEGSFPSWDGAVCKTGRAGFDSRKERRRRAVG